MKVEFSLTDYIRRINSAITAGEKMPWTIIANLEQNLAALVAALPTQEFNVKGTVAIHRLARIEEHVIIKGPAIISQNVFIGAHAYLRGGVWLGEQSSIGPGCEVKTSAVHSRSALAHFNFVGDSILGENVNMEAGSVIANHFNERHNKTIFVLLNNSRHAIDSKKFGALVGDGCRIGANAVLSPGTILAPDAIVRRLELVEQCPE
jgi:bifunctional N-acetylglucosamine-1-phosphate-uridyltransferase/glucosamine-1-phosphate-acetyltransferase GlmU-like protein